MAKAYKVISKIGLAMVVMMLVGCDKGEFYNTCIEEREKDDMSEHPSMLVLVIDNEKFCEKKKRLCVLKYQTLERCTNWYFGRGEFAKNR